MPELGAGLEAGKIVVDAAEHPKAVVEAGEATVEKGKSVAGKLVRGATTTAKDVAGVTAADVALNAAKGLLSGGNNNGGNNEDSADTIASDPNLNVESLRGTEETGITSTPTGSTAENIAESIVPESVENLRGTTPPPPGEKNSTENSKLDVIISVLRSIKNTNQSIVRALGTGFSSIEKTTANTQRAANASTQAQRIERSSDHENRGFLGNLLAHPIATGLKTVATGAIASAAFGFIMEKMRHPGGANEKAQAATGNTEDAIVEAKKNYGKDWATKLVEKAEEAIQKSGSAKADSKAEEAENIYLMIKKALDQDSNKSDKDAIIAAIADLLKMKPAAVEDAIKDAHSFGKSKWDVFNTGMDTAVVNGMNSLLNAAYMGEGLIGGGLLQNLVAPVLSGVGAEKAAAAVYYKGSDIIDTHAKAVQDAKEGEAKAHAAQQTANIKLEALNNPNTFRAGNAITNAALSIAGPGKIKTLVKVGAGFAGLDFLSGGGESDLNQFASGFSETSNNPVGGTSNNPVGGTSNNPEGVSGGENSAKSATPGTLDARKAEALSFFEGKGYSKEQAAAIVANLIQESNLDPDISPKTGEDAYGIAQWHPERRAKFKEITGHDMKGSSFEDQLNFVNWELNHTFKKAGDRLKASKTVGDATGIVDRNYEKSSKQDEQTAIRTKIAESLLSRGNADVAAVKTTQPPPTPISEGVASTQGGPGSQPIVINHGGSNVSQQTHVDATSAMPSSYLFNQVVPQVA